MTGEGVERERETQTATAKRRGNSLKKNIINLSFDYFDCSWRSGQD
jgi:hypothetical protein